MEKYCNFLGDYIDKRTDMRYYYHREKRSKMMSKKQGATSMWEKDLLGRILFDGCMEEIILFREDGQILDANPAAKRDTGYYDELLTCNVADIFPQIFYVNEGKLENRESYVLGKSFTSVAYCKNKLCFPVRIKILWQSADDNSEPDAPKMGFCISGDISYQKEARKREDEASRMLEQTNQMRNEFVATVTHELRTPVNGIRGLAADLKKNSLSQDQMEDVDIIMHCCDNMTSLIGNLLDFSKLEAGKLELEQRKFSLKAMLDKVVAFYRPLVRRKGLKLVVNIASDIPDEVIGDDLRVEQIFHNLISNAVKYTSEGYVALEVLVTRQTENSIELFSRIIDTGIGIPEEKLDTLFLSFSQVDSSITRKYGGTGLGLSISKKLVTMMDGSIRVDSEYGKGSIFSFTIHFGIEEQDAAKKAVSERPVDQNVALREWLEPSELAPKDRKKHFMEIMERFTISTEMENKEKAEEFAEQLKAMLPEAGRELWRAIFRVQMDIRKADYERAAADMEKLQEMLRMPEFEGIWVP